LEWTKN